MVLTFGTVLCGLCNITMNENMLNKKLREKKHHKMSGLQ